MADYKEIKGVKIQHLLADPSGGNLFNGRVWFNASSGNLKYRREEVAAVGGSWTTGGNMNVKRRNNAGANVGTQTAALSFTGMESYSSTPTPTSGPTQATSKATEEYDGSAWTSQSNCSTDRVNAAGGGTQTSGLLYGGLTNPGTPPQQYTTATEEYNGTSWGGGGSLPRGRYYMAGCGPQNAAFCFGGQVLGSPPAIFQTEANDSNEYDGSSWTVGGTLAGTPSTGQTRTNSGAAGTQTAGLAFGGRDGAVKSTQHYDGTSWSVAANMINNAAFISSGMGTQTAALSIGAEPNTTQEYDGTSWIQGVTNPSNQKSGAGAGTTSAAVIFGGYPPFPSSQNTYEYNGPITTGRISGGNKFIS